MYRNDADYLYDDCVSDPASRILQLGGGVSTYGVVRLTRSTDYVSNLNCAMRIDAPAGYSLFVEIAWVDIESTTTTCGNNQDYLQITSSTSNPSFGNIALPLQGLSPVVFEVRAQGLGDVILSRGHLRRPGSRTEV